jgi:hypothetical protein
MAKSNNWTIEEIIVVFIVLNFSPPHTPTANSSDIDHPIPI